MIGILLAATLTTGVFEIGEAMQGEAFWKSDPVLFVSAHQKNGFKFTSEGREAADSRREGGVTCFGLAVYETRLNFGAQGGISRVELTLFNRGGTEGVEEVSLGGGETMQRVKRVEKNMTKDEFFAAVETVQAKLTPKGKKPPKAESKRLKNTDIHQYAQTWPKAEIPGEVTLTWNYEQAGKKSAAFNPGFIRLAVQSAEGNDHSTTTTSNYNSPKKSGKLTDNIVKESRGDIFIDNVPMVDQGRKGYCAAAASERVLRYYGVEVDEHEIAVAAGTQAEGGTTMPGMVRSVGAIGKRYHLAVTELYGDTEANTDERIKKLEDAIKAYNKAAKKLKRPVIPESVYIHNTGGGMSYDPVAAEAAMEPEVRKEMKVNGVEKPKYAKFMKNVRQNVNAGLPLVWGVTLGIYPETDLPQAQGGHMRLIIGYNDKKNEILYTDTWGKGHELKRMPADWAWTISHSLIVLRPLK